RHVCRRADESLSVPLLRLPEADRQPIRRCGIFSPQGRCSERSLSDLSTEFRQWVRGELSLLPQLRLYRILGTGAATGCDWRCRGFVRRPHFPCAVAVRLQRAPSRLGAIFGLRTELRTLPGRSIPCRRMSPSSPPPRFQALSQFLLRPSG